MMHFLRNPKHAVDDILHRPNYFYSCLFVNISATIILLPDSFYPNILHKRYVDHQGYQIPGVKVRAIRGVSVLN
jgi:hypothetical protein